MKMPISKYAIGLYAILCAVFGLNILFLQPVALRPSLSSSTTKTRSNDNAIAWVKQQEKKESAETSSLTHSEDDTLTNLIERNLKVPVTMESLSQKDSIALRPSLSSSTTKTRSEDNPIAWVKQQEKKESAKTSSLTHSKDDTLTTPIEKNPKVTVTTESLPQKDSIRALQIALGARGYRTGQVNGVVGSVTEAAILAFEFDHNLPLTGQPQPYLLKKVLDNHSERVGMKGVGKPASPTAERIIRSVQQTLSNLGYSTGPVDGELNEKTIASIRQFEAQQGLPNTGRISGELIVRLSRLSSKASKIGSR